MLRNPLYAQGKTIFDLLAEANDHYTFIVFSELEILSSKQLRVSTWRFVLSYDGETMGG